MALEQCLIRTLAARVITRSRQRRSESLLDEKRFLESFQETHEQQRIASIQAIATKRNTI